MTGDLSVERVRAHEVREGDHVWDGEQDGWGVVQSIDWTNAEGGYYSYSAEDEDGKTWAKSWVAGRWVLRLLTPPSEQEQQSELPPELRRVLEDPSVVIRQDQHVFELLAKWQQAKATTASESPLASSEQEGELIRAVGELRSNCCSAPVLVVTVDEGRSCYVCSKCERPPMWVSPGVLKPEIVEVEPMVPEHDGLHTGASSGERPPDVERNTYTTDRARGLHAAALRDHTEAQPRGGGREQAIEWLLKTGIASASTDSARRDFAARTVNAIFTLTSSEAQPSEPTEAEVEAAAMRVAGFMLTPGQRGTSGVEARADLARQWARQILVAARSTTGERE